MVLRGLSVLPLRAQHRARQRPGGSLCLGAGGAAYHPSFSGKKAGGEAGTPVASPAHSRCAGPAAPGPWGQEAEGVSSVQTSCLLPRIFSVIKDHGNVS